MQTDQNYSLNAPPRAEIDALTTAAVIEFGNDWCGHCNAAQPLIAAAMANHPAVRHIKIADGKGLPLGRSYQVKLWPTLIFLKGGVEKSRLVRPLSIDAITEALGLIDTTN